MKPTQSEPEQLHQPGRWLRSVRNAGLAGMMFLALPGLAEAVEPLSVEGSHVLVGGQQTSLAGMSLFWSNNGWGGEKFYTADVVRTLKQDWNASIVRAAMGVDEPGGYLQDKAGNLAKVETVIQAAIANDMYVIVDWHSHHAEQHTQEAIAFFQEIARKYGQHDNIIYEIYNEPLQVSWSGVIKPYAEAVIGAIRAIDPDNLIVVGTPFWSQNVDEAALDPVAGNNIAYTLHFYAGTHKDYLRQKARTAMARGIALFATEWGTVNADGNGAVDHASTEAWMAFLKENGISHANWAVNDKAEGASVITPGGSWNSLTESGKTVKAIVQNWHSSGGNGTEGSAGAGNGGIVIRDCTAVTVPATIEAEAFCQMDGMQTESTADAGGGQNLGWTDAGDWSTYRINIPHEGRYRVTLRVASEPGGGEISVEKAGGSAIYGTVTVPATGGWQSWQDVSLEVDLKAGDQLIGIAAVAGGWNLNWLRFDAVNTSGTASGGGTGGSQSAPGSGPTATSDRNDDWLHVEGNQIVDLWGNPVWLTGANWFGFNTTERVFHGLWSANMKDTLRSIAERGFNILRVPISTELLLEWKRGDAAGSNAVNTWANPELKGMTTLEVFDAFLAAAKEVGLKVLLDVHSAAADNMGHLAPLWYNDTITSEDFYSTWEWVADRYKNDDTLIAFDLENEPHGKPWAETAAKWDDSQDENNWKYACETAARRILAINPNVLTMCEGIESYPRPGKDWNATSDKDFFNTWWGGNLRGVRDYPVRLAALQKQFMYSPHDYGPSVWVQPWFKKDFNKQTLIEDAWYDNWLYLHDEGISPVLIGEWGGFLDGGDNEKWMLALRDLIAEKKLHHTFWAINPNSGDTGGLLGNDWVTWDEAKYALVKPVLWTDSQTGKFVGLDHRTPLGSTETGLSLGEFTGNGGSLGGGDTGGSDGGSSGGSGSGGSTGGNGSGGSSGGNGSGGATGGTGSGGSSGGSEGNSQPTVLRCELGTVNDWGSGYVLEGITVTNVSAQPVTDWTVDLDFVDGVQVANLWNGTFEIVNGGRTLRVSNAPWNGQLAPGASATFGFQGNHSGPVTLPACKAR